jgi:hypothetical protein
MDALLGTIHNTGPAMKTFILTKHTGDFRTPAQFKNIFRTGLYTKLATRAEGAVDLNRHNRSSC